MTYSVKEIFYTLQGEGAQAGRAAVFCRFAGCNLWSGREQDRAAAVCRFCDTDFVGTDGLLGGKYRDPARLAAVCRKLWRDAGTRPFIVLTGGEPLLQLDEDLLKALKAADFEIAIESNGTLPCPSGIDWICISPKAGADLVQTSGDELKLVYPQTGLRPEDVAHLEFRHFFLQPRAPLLMDEADQAEYQAEWVQSTRAAVEYCLAHPQWRLSEQSHKRLGLP